MHSKKIYEPSPEELSLTPSTSGPLCITYADLKRMIPGFDAEWAWHVAPARMADGHPNLQEITILTQLVRSVKPTTIFQFGTFDGLTATNLALNAPQAIVYTLDLPIGKKPRYSHLLEEQKYHPRTMPRAFPKNVTYISADSADYNENALQSTIDFIFIDGSHAPEYVKNDSKKALALARPGALIVWHDYAKPEWPAVTAYLNELAQHHRLYWVNGKSTAEDTSLVLHIRHE